MHKSEGISAAREELVRWFTEPLEKVRRALDDAGVFDDKVPTLLELLDALTKSGFVPGQLSQRYKEAFHRIRYGQVAESSFHEVAAIRDELAGALPGPERLVTELGGKWSSAAGSARETAEEQGAQVIGGQAARSVPRGWTRPPVVWDVAGKQDREEEEADEGGHSGSRRWSPFLIGTVAVLFLLVWTVATAATTYTLRHRITAVIWKLRYGRDYRLPGRQFDSDGLRTLLTHFARRDLSEDERAELAGQVAREAFSRDEFLLAEHFYRVALERRPTDAELLNELAWMLLTRGESWFQDPLQGYNLARRAVQLSPRPHIKDTLAEAYYLLGRYEQAVALEEEVLSEATKGRDFYRQQLEKFRRALEESRNATGAGTASRNAGTRSGRSRAAPDAAP